MRLSRRAEAVGESVTLALAEKARQLKAAGRDVLAFTTGEPDFDTPEHIKEACRRALSEGRTTYTAVHGIQPLREAIAAESEAARGLSVDPNRNVIVSCGAKHAIYNAVLATCGEGDEVIVPAPYWVSYVDIVRLSGATPVLLKTREADGFSIDPAALADAVTPRTRLLLFSNPQNPTGAVQPPETWSDVIAALPEEVLVLSDEIYRKLSYSGEETPSILQVLPGIRDRVLVVDGVSKAYAMTGWRIGWTIAPEPVVAAMKRIQSHSTSNPASPSQYAALSAVTGDQEPVARMLASFRERRQLVISKLREIPGVTLHEPDGAFYVFPGVASLLPNLSDDEGRRVEDTMTFCRLLLERTGVALVPGEAFGAPGFVRLSYAAAREDLVDGLGRFAEFVQSGAAH